MRCDAVTASGFASVVCQLEIVRSAVVEPDVVMDASVHSVGRSLSPLNTSHARLGGALQLNHLEFISILVVDMCNGFTTTVASAVVANRRVLRFAAFCACCLLLASQHSHPSTFVMNTSESRKE